MKRQKRLTRKEKKAAFKTVKAWLVEKEKKRKKEGGENCAAERSARASEGFAGAEGRKRARERSPGE